ncbi:flagellar motor protein [Azohydromonas caseinilytica]|uniref:Flagellar motor protein n=1 Tax=Azohydromonas caseinilytica TaxID=2728836 RepID=A0A848F3T9_9BURK|nr:flagellar motor protein [Azohydromonas caseinilytica]NML14314.1 flagellar motor protein [Azohydromonas caseinilytica]
MLAITLLGLIVGIAAVLTGQAMEGGKASSLIQPSAFLIVIGGTLGAVLVQSTPGCALRAVKMLAWLVIPPKGITPEEIKTWTAMAEIGAKKGLPRLEDTARVTQDPFLKKALELVADNHRADFIRERLLTEIKIRDAQLRVGARVWEAAAGYAPTIGILGSVLGLLHVMESLKDPSRLGTGIAVAFVATIYGLVTANLLYLPIAGKLKVIISAMTLRDEMRMEAAAAIASGESPSRVRERLTAFVNGVAS